MGIKFSNNGHSTLAASITSSGTSITVASGHGSRFPSLAAGDYFYATLIDASNNLEIVKCTARSSDVLTVTRGAESTTARAYAIGDRIELRVTAAGLDEAAQIYDKDTTSTGYFDIPSGTTAQEPGNGAGRIRFDTDLGVVMFNDGSDWYKIAAQIAQLSSVSGNIFAGAGSTLTLTGSGFLTANLVVNFTQASDSIDADVTVTPTNDTSATVTVPSAVYSNVTSGNTVSVQVTNSDGMSSASVNKTAIATPSGGTVTTSGGYRVHTFTSSGTFTNTVSNLSVEYFMVAGGASGGSHNAGGGGAGGVLSGTTTASAQAYSFTVGSGGSAAVNVEGVNGNNTTAFGLTAIGGGGGGTESGTGSRNGKSGGSGGGGGAGTNGSTTRAGGSGTSGQGYAGGSASTGGVNWRGGGGGGASQAGATGNASGDGGDGVTNNWTGTSYYFAGGGGGAPYENARGGDGGLGGGGGGGHRNSNGSQTDRAGYGAAGYNAGSNGTKGSGNNNDYGGNAGANSGGGGGANNGPGYNSGAGGSGIVIVRYQL